MSLSRNTGPLVIGIVLIAQLLLAPIGPPVVDPGGERRSGIGEVRSPDGLAPDLASVAAVPEALGDGSMLTLLVSRAGEGWVGLVPPIAYSRWDDSDPLENENRRRIYEQVAETPGHTLSSIADATDIPTSTVRYHVRILVGERLVVTDRVLGQRRLYEWPPANEALTAVLRNAATARILETVRRLEPVGVTDVATSVERSPSTVSYHLSRIEDEGLVSKERDGRSVEVRLTPEARRGLDGTSVVG